MKSSWLALVPVLLEHAFAQSHGLPSTITSSPTLTQSARSAATDSSLQSQNINSLWSIGESLLTSVYGTSDTYGNVQTLTFPSTVVIDGSTIAVYTNSAGSTTSSSVVSAKTTASSSQSSSNSHAASSTSTGTPSSSFSGTGPENQSTSIQNTQPTSSAASSSSNGEKSHSTPIVAIVVGVVVGLIVLILIIILALCLLRRRRRGRVALPQSEKDEAGAGAGFSPLPPHNSPEHMFYTRQPGIAYHADAYAGETRERPFPPPLLSGYRGYHHPTDEPVSAAAYSPYHDQVHEPLSPENPFQSAEERDSYGSSNSGSSTEYRGAPVINRAPTPLNPFMDGFRPAIPRRSVDRPYSHVHYPSQSEASDFDFGFQPHHGEAEPYDPTAQLHGYHGTFDNHDGDLGHGWQRGHHYYEGV